MGSLQENVLEYKKQMQKGTIQRAYKGLMEYIMSLRTHFQNKYPDYFVSGSIYYGYMDMTYFGLSPEAMKSQGLKFAIVFIHETCRFEVWLFAYNKKLQEKFWKFFKQSGWDKYRLVPTIRGADSILESVLVEDPDFSDLDALTRQIEKGTLAFIKDIQSFLDKQ
jgi:hypothetical protein